MVSITPKAKTRKVTQGTPVRFSGRRLFYDIDEIDEICHDALAHSGFLPDHPSPIDIERFVEKHFGCEIGYERLPDEVLGLTAFDNNGTVILMRVADHLEDGTKVGERRVRTTWAHEAGHGLLHSQLFVRFPDDDLNLLPSANTDQNRFLCRDPDIRPVGKSYDRRWWEWQANRAIGGLLLPRHLARASVEYLTIRSIVTGGFSLPIHARLSAEKTVSETFNVNPVVARIRLADLFPDRAGNQLEF